MQCLSVKPQFLATSWNCAWVFRQESSVYVSGRIRGAFYFFLPSGAGDYRIDFCNLGTDSTLQLDSDIYTSDNSTIYSLEYSKSYEMELHTSQEGQPVERGQVIFLKSEGLPSLFIDTASGNMEAVHSDKEIKEEASVWLIDAEGDREYSGKIEYIKSRGNSTFNAEKKPYQIKLLKNASLPGMPSAEKWILLANAFDDTLIRNEIVFRFADRYSVFPSIRGEFVDLYLNGEYAGDHYLCEKIEVGENRLNITDLEEKTEQVNFQKSYENAVLYVSDDGKIKAASGLQNPEDITGGYRSGKRYRGGCRGWKDYITAMRRNLYVRKIICTSWRKSSATSVIPIFMVLYVVRGCQGWH